MTRDEFLGGLCGIDSDAVAEMSANEWGADLRRAARAAEAASRAGIRRSPSSRLSNSPMRFQLANVRVTSLRS